MMIGKKCKFKYSGCILEEYKVRDGCVVTVLRQLCPPEVEVIEEIGVMYAVLDNDGWEGHVFEDELEVIDD